MTILLYVLGVVLFVVGIGASIALHEIGHLIPAKKFGVKVNQYMIGFGPTIWSRRGKETEYGVKAFPMGGYISMIGMYPPAKDGTLRRSSTGMFQTVIDDARKYANEEVRPGEEHRTFYNLSVPKKLVVMLGGPTMNLIISIVVLAIAMCGIGVQQPTTTVSTVSQCVVDAGEAQSRAQAGENDCRPADPKAPAALAGVKPGDTILSIAGTTVSGWPELSTAIRGQAGKTVPVVVRHADGTTATLSVGIIASEQPRLDANGNAVVGADGKVQTVSVGFLGVGPTQERMGIPVSALSGQVWSNFTTIVGAIVHLPQRLVGVAQAAFSSQARDPNSPVGVVGVGRVAGEIASTDQISVLDKVWLGLSVLATLNMFLFAFNLVPLLPLDGGHVAGALWEGLRRWIAKIRGRANPGPVDIAKLLPLTYVIVGLMLVMTLLLVYADIVKPIKLF